MFNRNEAEKKYMAFFDSPPTKSAVVSMVSDEKFAQIYTADEEAVQLLDNGRTMMNVKLWLPACALGIHSYSSGIHSIRIRMDKGTIGLGIRSRNIPFVPDLHDSRPYYESPSTYGWLIAFGPIRNGVYYENQLENMNRNGHVYTIILNCDERRLSIFNENTKEQDEMEVDISYAPLPWCLFIFLPRILARVSLI